MYPAERTDSLEDLDEAGRQAIPEAAEVRLAVPVDPAVVEPDRAEPSAPESPSEE